MSKEIKVEEPCPSCGAEHTDKELDSSEIFGRLGKNNVWWWKCLNPDCNVAYYSGKEVMDEGENGDDDYDEIVWDEEFINIDVCSLCGNKGVIDTRGVTSPSGVEVGKLNYCICPNGRNLKKNNEDMDKVLEHFGKQI